MHPQLKVRTTLPRILALWLILGLALPSPAWALRPREATELPATRVGLEGELRGNRPQPPAGITLKRVISPEQGAEFEGFILAVLAESAGLEESALAARREFGDMLDTVFVLGPQL